MTPAEQASIELIKAGNIPAVENLFTTNYSVLCIYAKSIVGDIDDARDIVQNVFVTLYSNRQSIEISTSIKSYLYKSVYNGCLNHLSRIKIHNRHHETLSSQSTLSDYQDTMAKVELEEKIWAIIQGLPQQCRKIFEMSRFEGKKNSEIAEALDISIRTVETQISKALKILRTNLSDFLVTFLLLILAP